MKKLVIMLVVLSLTMFLFVGCDGNDEDYNSPTAGTAESPTQLEVTEFSSTIIDGIEFGLSPEQLLTKLDDLGLELVLPENAQMSEFDFEQIDDGRVYNSDASFFFLTANGEKISFDSYGDITAISVLYNADFITAEGLRIGDSIERITEIYGTNYRQGSMEYSFYQFYNGEYYMTISYNMGLVVNISITEVRDFFI